MDMRKLSAVLACALFFGGCTSTRHPAPVSDRTQAPVPAAKPVPATAATQPQLAREPDTRPETYTVKADGRVLTCEPAKVLPMAQRYFLF